MEDDFYVNKEKIKTKKEKAFFSGKSIFAFGKEIEKKKSDDQNQ